MITCRQALLAASFLKKISKRHTAKLNIEAIIGIKMGTLFLRHSLQICLMNIPSAFNEFTNIGLQMHVSIKHYCKVSITRNTGYKPCTADLDTTTITTVNIALQI